MVRRRSFVYGACVAIAWPALALGQTFDPSADPVFQKALAVNRGLKSYRARISVRTRLVLGGFALHGNVYQRGGMTKIAFDDVPAIAKSFVENQPSIGDPATWPQKYVMSVAQHDADTTTYHLVPRAASSVRSIDVVLANQSGLAQRYVWANANGVTITSEQQYETLDGFELVGSSTSATRGPAVKADSVTTFSDYEINVNIPDSVFSG